MRESVHDALKKTFRPEFLNRIDGTVVFHALSKDHILSIVDLMLDNVREQLREKGIELEVTQKAKELLVDKGYDPTFGARPLRRVIQDDLEDLLSEDLLGGRIGSGDTVYIDAEEGKFVARSEAVAVPSS